MKKMILILMLGLTLAACQTSPKTKPIVVTSNNVQTAMELPDADKARSEAPIFTMFVLKTINALELQIKEDAVK